MLRFDSPVYLYLLLMIPVFVGLMVLAEYKRRKAIKKLGDAQLIAQLMPDASTKRRSTGSCHVDSHGGASTDGNKG